MRFGLDVSDTRTNAVTGVCTTVASLHLLIGSNDWLLGTTTGGAAGGGNLRDAFNEVSTPQSGDVIHEAQFVETLRNAVTVATDRVIGLDRLLETEAERVGELVFDGRIEADFGSTADVDFAISAGDRATASFEELFRDPGGGPAAVPEPGTTGLLAAALTPTGPGGMHRRRRRSR